jgi:4-hydroxy-tetrahydrodipicolinate synthase
VVASGHISDSFADQVKELTLIAETGVDAVILISNRFDIDNTGDAKWVCDLNALAEQLPKDVALGVYECPYPYKRLLTPAMLEACIKTGRFTFIKDTCCDAKLIASRVRQLHNTGVNLFNANSLTLLESLRSGAAGFSGIMGNFHPQLYSWLCRNYKTQPETADKVQAFLSLASLTETMAYPCTAKYHLSEIEGIKMEYTSRARDVSQLTEYQKSCIRQMDLLARAVYTELK